MQASFYVAEVRRNYFDYYWHYHPEVEFTLVLQGQGTRIVGDSIENFERGDLCLVGSNLPHCWFSEKAQSPSGRCIVLQFLPHFLGETFLGVPELQPIRQLLIRAQRGLRVEGKTRAAVTAKILALWRLPIGHWQRPLALLGILGTLAESTECTPLATNRTGPDVNWHDQDRMNQILEATNVPLDELPSQKNVAATMRMSPAAFSRFFKHSMGKTYIDHIIDLRLAHVCQSLINTNKPITEIAFAVGFKSLSNFNRLFRQRKGTSPNAWRDVSLNQRKD